MLAIALLPLITAIAVPPIKTADQSLTYSTAAQPMKRVFAELSVRAGVKLEVSAEFAREPLILRVQDVALNDLLDRIAQTVQAEWQREGDGFRLVRTPKMRRVLEEGELELRTIEAREILDRERKWLADHPRFDESEAEQLAEKVANALRPDPETRKDPMMEFERTRAVNDGSPLMRLLRRLVCTFDARTLALLPMEERVVFSLHPGALQQRFPNGAEAAVAAFEREGE